MINEFPFNINQYFSNNKFIEVFNKFIKYSTSVGIDRITPENFEHNLLKNSELISQKILNNIFCFTPYKEKLLLKGKNKLPRVISIPTVKDKIVIKILQECLSDIYDLKIKQVQTIINEIKTFKDIFDSYIKIDIKRFYSSINHDILIKKLKQKIKNKTIISLIYNAITNVTQSEVQNDELAEKNSIGVPEGLSFSNILANIYLNNLDNKYGKLKSIVYYRYVDDILIFCNNKSIDRIKSKLENDLNKFYCLEINKDKYASGYVNDGFSYLGYDFLNNSITVRKTSLMKFEKSLEKMFVEFKRTKYHRNYLIWKLNLKITGCINNNKKYGFLFFFSQINNPKLLFHLDWLIKKLYSRYNLIYDSQLTKKFSRSFHEIYFNLSKTNYIPNFTNYTIEKMKKVLTYTMKDNEIVKMSENEIKDKFKKFIFKSISELEKDQQQIS